jgi:hypothetical protein
MLVLLWVGVVVGWCCCRYCCGLVLLVQVLVLVLVQVLVLVLVVVSAAASAASAAAATATDAAAAADDVCGRCYTDYYLRITLQKMERSLTASLLGYPWSLQVIRILLLFGCHCVQYKRTTTLQHYNNKTKNEPD